MPSLRHRRVVMRRHGAAIAAAGVLALAFSGCTGAPESTPTPSASASASTDPVFASDEEALAAAEAAYEQFLVVSSQITGSGGEDTAALEAVATGAAYRAQLDTANAYAEDRIHSTGRRVFTTYELQAYSADPGGGVVVAFYACDDLRGLDVVDAAGVSVVAPDRIVDVPYLVVVEGTVTDLKVSEKELWERENFCA